MGPKNETFSWTLTDIEKDLPKFSEDFRAFCESAGVHEDKIFELELSMEELIVNSFSHGYKEGGTVVVAAEKVNADLKVSLEDRAPPFNLLRDAPDPPILDSLKERQEGGLGIHLVKNLNDRVEYHGSTDGNRVTIIKSIG